MALDIEKEMAGIIRLVPPDVKLAFETVPIASRALNEVDQDYGPDSESPREFHDAPHSIGSIRRGVVLTTMLRRYIKPSFQPRMYELVIVGDAVHDRYQNRGADNEISSAGYGVDLVEEFDGPLNTKTFKRRLPRGVLATAVNIESDGRVVQTNMLRGSRDPLKFIMSFSDKNGIAMEGEKRMWPDATDLYYEITPQGEQSDEGLGKFLGEVQQQFLRQGLNDPLIKAYIARYFPDYQKAVYDDMHKAFHDNITEAHALAEMVTKHPELHRAMGRIASMFDSSRAGPLIGKMVRRKHSRSSKS